MHVLDRPVWNAMTTRQAHLAISDGAARRYRPDVNVFAATANYSPSALTAVAALAQLGEMLVILEEAEAPAIPGTRVERVRTVNQMAWQGPAMSVPSLDYVALGNADAAEMLALATMTEPGPFSTATHLMGDFIGVRENGRLIAMAGQRFRVTGFVEVSAVCTHPEHRGAGLAGKLMRVLIERIVAGGDTPFLHTYPENSSAIRLYETLGFRFRAALTGTFLARLDPAQVP